MFPECHGRKDRRLCWQLQQLASLLFQASSSCFHIYSHCKSLSLLAWPSSHTNPKLKIRPESDCLCKWLIATVCFKGNLDIQPGHYFPVYCVETCGQQFLKFLLYTHGKHHYRYRPSLKSKRSFVKLETPVLLLSPNSSNSLYRNYNLIIEKHKSFKLDLVCLSPALVWLK